METNFYSTKAWGELRRETFKRDNQRCRRCGHKFTQEYLDAHHMTPRLEGGADDLSNLLTLCDDCHDYVEINQLRSVAAIEGSYNGTTPVYGFKKPPRNSTPARKRGRPKSTEADSGLVEFCSRFHLGEGIFTYRAAAKKMSDIAGYRVGPATIWNFIRGTEPHSPRLRQLFRLPFQVSVTACACGQVHVKRGRCPNAPRPAELARYTAAIDWLAARQVGR